MRPHILLLAIPALAVLSSHVAHADSVSLREGFSPNPLTVPVIEKRMEKVSMSDMGFGACGSSSTTADPAFRFTLETKLKGLNLIFASKSGGPMTNALVKFPDGSIECAKHSNVERASWPKGRYEVFFFSSSYTASASLRFEQAERIRGQLDAAWKAAPLVDTSQAGRFNSQFVDATVRPEVTAEATGLSCAPASSFVAPVARLRVERSGTHFVASRGHALVLERDGKCALDQAARESNNNHARHYSLEPGTYRIWIHEKKAGPQRVSVEVDERGLMLAFGAADLKRVGRLDEPQLFSGVTQTPQVWPTRAPRECSGTARKPDFYLKSASELSKVRLFAVGGRRTIHVYGPIDKNPQFHCGQSSYDFESFKGHYAVWSVPDKAGAGESYQLAALRTDVELDPLTTLQAIPKAPRGPERIFSRHYPFYGQIGPALAFEKADERMFVYAKEDLSDAIARHAPLLVGNVVDGKAYVIPLYGESMWVETNRLAGERPATVSLPNRPVFVAVSDYGKASESRRQSEEPLFAPYRATLASYRKCVGKFMKRDPTWGKNYELVRTSGPHAGETLTDALFRKAAKKCHEGKVLKAEKKLLETLNKQRKAQAAATLSQVRARFGLTSK